MRNEKQSDYPAINKKGQMSYRVGYNSSLYSVYLRRDGASSYDWRSKTWMNMQYQ